MDDKNQINDLDIKKIRYNAFINLEDMDYLNKVLHSDSVYGKSNLGERGFSMYIINNIISRCNEIKNLLGD